MDAGIAQRTGGLTGAVIAAVLLCSGVARGNTSIAVDAVVSNRNTTAGTLVTLPSITIGSGANRALIVGVGSYGASPATTVMFNSTSMTSLGFHTQGLITGGTIRIEIFALIAPPPGSATVTISAATASLIVAGATSFTGVLQASPFGTFAQSGVTLTLAPASMAVASAAGDVVFDTIADSQTTTTVTALSAGSAQTQRWQLPVTTGPSGTYPLSAGSTAAALGTTTTVSWTLGVLTTYSYGAIAIHPATIPTAADFTDLRASFDPSRGALLHWQTGADVDVLGFHVYRDAPAGRERITPSLIAGSALTAGDRAVGGVPRYTWRDASGTLDSAYWIESVTLRGDRVLHGPIRPDRALDERFASSTVSTLLAAAVARPPVTVGMSAAPRTGAWPRPALPPADVTHAAARDAAQWQIASQSAVRIAVRRDGWVRVDRDPLVAAGLDVTADAADLALYTDGIAQPFEIARAADGSIASIAFVGNGLDLPSTDQRIYWLVRGGSPGLRLTARTASPGLAAPSGYPFTVTRADRSLYFAALRNGDASNFFGPVVGPAAATQSFTLSHLDRGGSLATMTVALQGVTSDPLDVSLACNGVPVGTVHLADQQHVTRTFDVPLGALIEGDNTVTLTPVGAGVAMVDSMALTHPHRYVADGDALAFTVDGGRRVTLTGFGADHVRAMDVTDATDVYELTGTVAGDATGHSLTVDVPGTGRRRIVAFDDAGAVAPVSVRADTPSSWHAPHDADLLIVTHGAFAASLAPLVAQRRREGWRVEIADIEDVYDEFAFGTKDPAALRAFLRHARTTWTRAPHDVLLVGDASVDPRDFLGRGSVDWLPTHLMDSETLETATDDWFADFDDDGLPEMVLGRLPVSTPAMADAIVARTLAFDPSASREALLVAGAADDVDFASVTAAAADALGPGFTRTTFLASTHDTATVHAELAAQLSAGNMLVNYAGHGSVESWQGLLDPTDVAALPHASRPSIHAVMTCLNGFFHDVYTQSLAERLLASPSGSAVAVWASSALTGASAQQQLDTAFLRAIGRGSLGDATRAAKRAVTDGDVRRTFILFGDPTLLGAPPPRESPDAGVADVVAIDAATTPDAAVLDAGAPDAIDPMSPRPQPAGGCAIAHGAASRSDGWLIALALAAVLARRRARC